MPPRVHHFIQLRTVITSNSPLEVVGSDCNPRQTLITIYISMVQSHFYYCSVVWGCCSQSLSQKLQKFQNCAARVVTFSYFDSCTEELFRELFWGKLDRQRCVDKAIMMYKIVNGAVPQYLCSCFVQRSDTLSS